MQIDLGHFERLAAEGKHALLGPDELEALIAKVRELEQDAARLDWLQAHTANGVGITSLLGTPREQWFVRFPVMESAQGMSIRGAIDAARKEKGHG